MIAQNTLMCTIVMLGKDAAGEMGLTYVSTQNNVVEVLTMDPPREKFEAFLKHLGLGDLSWIDFTPDSLALSIYECQLHVHCITAGGYY